MTDAKRTLNVIQVVVLDLNVSITKSFGQNEITHGDYGG